ncbi:hypothetical protein HNQ80_003708 [Anaerosolibacter carboniphilus]|uniref:Polymer-forming cytoskeletal protein n=1 Tax=Anaerosolibacter carboniphilus TaxID=1417629 RepID=A0A841L5J3_9FIRM|nr:hypothetical protein [Anaerosolibacter carboniphilus]MBB6217585.1 hypothetical protein [Anaerosolibacter carboniphilus]
MKNKGIRIMIVTIILMILITGTVFGSSVRQVSDMMGIFEDIHVPKDTVVYGSTVAIFGDILMEGKVNGDVVAIFGDIKVDGSVSGDTVAIFGDIHITAQGSVGGNAIQMLGGKMVTAPGARVGGEKISVASFSIGGLSGLGALLALIFSLTLGKVIIGYVFSILAILLLPDRFDHMALAVNYDIGKNFIIGILVIVGFYVLAAILVMVVIGIPFLLLLIPLMGLLSFTGNTAVKLAIGKKIEAALNKDWSQMMELFIGTLIYGVIELTLIGKSLIFVGKAIGIGAVIDSKFGKPILSLEPPRMSDN